MIRVVFEVLLPLLAPFGVYFLWVWSENRKARSAGTEERDWREGPWYWLIAASIVLAGIALAVTALTRGTEPGVYHAPVYKDGEIVPGYVEPPKEPVK